MTIEPEPPVAATPAGWYPDPRAGGVQRYWDGERWTEHVAAVQRAPAQAVVVRPPQPKGYTTRGVSGSEHLLHVILTVMTCGLWLPVYLIRMLAGRHRTVAKY
jgi:hypothetical protein